MLAAKHLTVAIEFHGVFFYTMEVNSYLYLLEVMAEKKFGHAGTEHNQQIVACEKTGSSENGQSYINLHVWRL